MNNNNRINNKSFNFCNNCGKVGHVFHSCKHPITSIGLLVFRMYENKLQYLLIRRKHSLGFVEFMRGKYPVHNYSYLVNIFNEMSNNEKEKIKTLSFDELWTYLWGEQIGIQYRGEEKTSNIIPYEEIFIGSNMKSYKHRYFVGYIDSNITTTYQYQETEVSDVKWMSIEDCNKKIRPYNLEKISILNKVNKVLQQYRLYS